MRKFILIAAFVGVAVAARAQQDKRVQAIMDSIARARKAQVALNAKAWDAYVASRKADTTKGRLMQNAERSDTVADMKDTTWDKSLGEVYGTKAEKHHEDLIGLQSDNRMLCRFIGFKQFYGQQLSVYMQARMDYGVDDFPTRPGYDVVVLSKSGIYMGTKPKKVIISFALNKDHRIVSGRVTGPFMPLAELFIRYWPQDPVWSYEAQLKPGVPAVKHCYGDLITFKWVNGKPEILITKDPSISFPIAQTGK